MSRRIAKVGEGCIFHGGADTIVLIVTPSSPSTAPQIQTSGHFTLSQQQPASSFSIPSCFFTEPTKPQSIADYWSLHPWPRPDSQSADFWSSPRSHTSFTIPHKSWKSLHIWPPFRSNSQLCSSISNHQPILCCRKTIIQKTLRTISMFQLRAGFPCKRPDVPSWPVRTGENSSTRLHN